MESLDNHSNLTPGPTYELNWCNEIDFMFLPFISFIIAFIALECMKRFIPHPPYGSNWGDKIADFGFLSYISFRIAFTALECMERYRKPYS